MAVRGPPVPCFVLELTLATDRRCVCWLDYSDLIGTSRPFSIINHPHTNTPVPVHRQQRNVSHLNFRVVCEELNTDQVQPPETRFSNPALYEVMRIIPLTLRITHYTRAPAAWPGRPTIHVAGDWHTATAPPELARVRGTVEITASGDVRWTLVRFFFFVFGRRRW
jgi:hypothetical protein